MSIEHTTPHSLGRRELLVRTAGAFTLIGLGGLATQTANAEETSSTVLTPQEEQGPFFVDEKLNRSDLLVDPTNNTMQPGLPLLLYITVSQVTHGVVSPLEGAYVDLWQANAQGLYSDEASQNTAGQKFLRGYQVTPASGTVHFLTIYPGWYHGRTTHIHAKIRLYTGTTPAYAFQTQFFFNDAITAKVYTLPAYARTTQRDTYNATDRVYNYKDCDTSAVSGTELQLHLSKPGTTVPLAVAYYHMYLDLTAPKPTCVGVSDGGVNE